jgi:hypothetical protein
MLVQRMKPTSNQDTELERCTLTKDHLMQRSAPNRCLAIGEGITWLSVKGEFRKNKVGEGLDYFKAVHTSKIELI